MSNRPSVLDGLTSGTCDCRLCQQGRRIRACLETLPAESEAAILIDELSEELCNVGFELDCLRVIMDGSWPTAVRTLEHALARAKAKQAEESK